MMNRLLRAALAAAIPAAAAAQSPDRADSRLEITGEVLYCPYPEIGPYQLPVRLLA